MIKVILIFSIVFISTYADEFDLNIDSKPAIFPMTKEEIRKYIPLIPRMLTEQELIQKAKKEKVARQKAEKIAKLKAEKINKNFSKNIKSVEKEAITIKGNSKDADFFDSLENVGDKPVNME